MTTPVKMPTAFGATWIALESTLLDLTTARVRRAHAEVERMTPASFIDSIECDVFYCADDGFTRLGFNFKTGKLFLVRDAYASYQEVKQRWDHDLMVYAYRTAIEEMLAGHESPL